MVIIGRVDRPMRPGTTIALAILLAIILLAATIQLVMVAF